MGCNPIKCVYGNVFVPQRYVLCFMMFFAVFNSYTMRISLNLAITVIASAPKVNKTNVTVDVGLVCPEEPETNKPKEKVREWSTVEIGNALGAFFPGYVITHIPGGMLSDTLGGKHVLGFGVLISSICSFLTPVSVYIGDWWLLTITRFVMGLSQGPVFPAVATLLAKWVPKKERGTLGTLVLTGPQIGSIAGLLVTSFIITQFKSWALVFYFWGLMGIVWYVFFFLMCFSEPHTHPFITPQEAEFLEQEIGKTKKLKIPWKHLTFYPPCLALMAGQIGHAFAFFLIVTNLPTYMKETLKFNIKKNAVLNAIPYLALWICGGISGVISDALINREMCSVGFIRKLYTTIASVGPSVCVVLAGYMGCSQVGAASMFILGMFFMGPFYPGMRINALDITKNFAGMLTAYVNGIGALAFSPVPQIIGWMAPENTVVQWRSVFWMVFIVCSVTNVVYVIWGSGERAEWDKEAEQNQE